MNSLYLQYPDDWEKIPLRKSLLKFDSGDWGDKPEKENEGYIVIRSTDFDELGRIVYDKSVKRIINEQTINKKYLEEGDILLNKSSGSDKHIGKVIYFKTTLNEKHHFSNFIQRLRTDHKKIINKYLHYFLSSEYGQMSTSRFIQTSSGLKNIDLKAYSKQKIPVPPLVEQRGIVEVLGCVDECIQLTDEIIGAAEELKRGLMQRLLTQGIGHTEYKQTPLGKIPKTWKIITLGKIIIDSQYGTSEKSDNEKIGYPTLRIPNVIGGEINLEDLKYVELEKNEAKKYLLQKGDILIVRTNANPDYIGRCASFNNEIERPIYASYLVRLKIDRSMSNPDYIKYLLNSDKGRRQIRRIARTSAGNYNLNVPSIKSIKMPLPPIEEQNEIVKIIQNAELKINEEKLTKKHFIDMKQGLMQLLLSGKVRVEVREDGLHRVGDSRETHN